MPRRRRWRRTRRREFLDGAHRRRRDRTPVTDHHSSTTGSTPRLRLGHARARRLFVAAFVLLITTSVPLFAADPESGSEWKILVGRIVDFAILAGVLVYFLRSPFAAYLRDRGVTIRKDLSEAAAIRTTAENQLAAVRSR